MQKPALPYDCCVNLQGTSCRSSAPCSWVHPQRLERSRRGPSEGGGGGGPCADDDGGGGNRADGACLRWHSADLLDEEEQRDEDGTRELVEESPSHHIAPLHMALRSTAADNRDNDGVAAASVPVSALVSRIASS